VSADTFAIVVSYQPDQAQLHSLVASLAQSGCKVIVVDNTPDASMTAHPSPFEIVRLGDNFGIARAQNVGIEIARAAGAQAILFFDQDSNVSTDLVQRLVSRLRRGEPQVVGAVYFDARQGFECPSYKLNAFGYPRKVSVGTRTEPFEVDARISSGSAITTAAFDVAGPLDEGLFLDYVDIEWCLRARARGVSIFVDPAATMRHTIGEKTFDVGNLRVFVDSPIRTYYRMRNSLLLLRKRHVPVLFAAKEITSELIHHFLQLLLVKDRTPRLQAYLLGIWHGVRGIDGRKA
jgi:rhamnosyltransferase